MDNVIQMSHPAEEEAAPFAMLYEASGIDCRPQTGRCEVVDFVTLRSAAFAGPFLDGWRTHDKLWVA